MKLYNLYLSNFATKSRLVIYEKGLNVEMAPIPGGELSSPEYAKINLLGKTPALEADGLLIPESEVINEYFEDKYPTPRCCRRAPRAAPGCESSRDSMTFISSRRCEHCSAR